MVNIFAWANKHSSLFYESTNSNDKF